MSVDRKLSERCNIGSYRSRYDRTIVDVFKINLGSLWSEKEATWEYYPGDIDVYILRKKKDKEQLRKTQKKQSELWGKNQQTEVAWKLKEKWEHSSLADDLARGGLTCPSCLLCLPLPHLHCSCLVCFHICLLPLDSPWLGNSKSRARDFYRTNSMLSLKKKKR